MRCRLIPLTAPVSGGCRHHDYPCAGGLPTPPVATTEQDHNSPEFSIMTDPVPDDEFTIPPAPGSESALDQGCTCPVLDNAWGRGRSDGTFWINGDCPMHVAHEPGSRQ